MPVVVKSGMVLGHKYLDPRLLWWQRWSRNWPVCYIPEFECKSGSILLKTAFAQCNCCTGTLGHPCVVLNLIRRTFVISWPYFHYYTTYSFVKASL